MERNNSLNPNFKDEDFASEGLETQYEWFAYTNFYATSIHGSLSDRFKKENDRLDYLSIHFGGITQKIFNAINNSARFLYRVKNPFVVDSTAYAPGGYVLGEYIRTLADFFETGKIIDKYSKGTDPWVMYKGRDLIIPLFYCDKDALEFLEWKANQYIENGAHSVTVIFLIRIKPNINNSYPQHSEYPRITEYSFAEALDLSGRGSLVSQLVEASNNNIINKLKYKLL